MNTKTVLEQAPDVEVIFTFNHSRKHPVREGYRPHHLVTGTYLTTGVHHYYDVDEVPPGGSAKGTITFLFPEAYPHCLWIGKEIGIQEGAHVVGSATVTRIFNPILRGDSPAEFQEARKMGDYMTIQKIWLDADFAQFAVECSSEVITARGKIYATDAMIDQLTFQLRQFLQGQVREVTWANEEKGMGSTPCLHLRFFPKDALGHIGVEVYLELEDGGDYSSHNCCFYLSTEMGLLDTFCNQLPLLRQKALPVTVTLNGSCLSYAP